MKKESIYLFQNLLNFNSFRFFFRDSNSVIHEIYQLQYLLLHRLTKTGSNKNFYKVTGKLIETLICVGCVVCCLFNALYIHSYRKQLKHYVRHLKTILCSFDYCLNTLHILLVWLYSCVAFLHYDIIEHKNDLKISFLKNYLNSNSVLFEVQDFCKILLKIFQSELSHFL